MKTMGKVILLLMLALMLYPLAFIAIMLDPFFKLFYKEEEDNGY
ncbi:TPA: hypothetical protein ACGPSD_001230 [Streptococcus agalactiae]